MGSSGEFPGSSGRRLLLHEGFPWRCAGQDDRWAPLCCRTENAFHLPSALRCRPAHSRAAGAPPLLDGCSLTVATHPIFLCENRNCIFTVFCSAPQSCRPKECPILCSEAQLLKCSSGKPKGFFIFRGCQKYPWASCLRTPFLRWLTPFFLS